MDMYDREEVNWERQAPTWWHSTFGYACVSMRPGVHLFIDLSP